jgi:hypothetical protein
VVPAALVMRGPDGLSSTSAACRGGQLDRSPAMGLEMVGMRLSVPCAGTADSHGRSRGIVTDANAVERVLLPCESAGHSGWRSGMTGFSFDLDRPATRLDGLDCIAGGVILC